MSREVDFPLKYQCYAEEETHYTSKIYSTEIYFK